MILLVSGATAQPCTKLDSAWKWPMRTMAWTSSDNDQLWAPPSSFYNTHPTQCVIMYIFLTLELKRELLYCLIISFAAHLKVWLANEPGTVSHEFVELGEVSHPGRSPLEAPQPRLVATTAQKADSCLVYEVRTPMTCSCLLHIYVTRWHHTAITLPATAITLPTTVTTLPITEERKYLKNHYCLFFIFSKT